MFELAAGQSFIQARPEEVLDIYNSINRSTVAAPNKTPEAAQAFIVSVYRDGLYHVHIHLHLSVSNEGLLYNWSGGGVPGDQLNGVYQAAFEFAESMGFMMDNMRYREKSPEEKAEAHAQVPGFHSDLSSFKGSDEDKAEELLIESLDEGEDAELQLEAVDEEEELSLGALTEDEEEAEEVEEVQEIMLGGEDDSVELGAALEAEPMVEEISMDENAALDALEDVEAPVEAAPVEDNLLNALEIGADQAAPEAPAAEAVVDDEAELALDSLMGEDTVEGTTVAQPVMEEVLEETPLAEAALTPEEAMVLGTIDSTPEAEAVPEEPEPIPIDDLEEEVPLAAAEGPLEPEADPLDEMTAEIQPPAPFPVPAAAPAPPAPEPFPAPAAMAAADPGPSPVPVPGLGGGVTEEERAVLVRFLAMM